MKRIIKGLSVLGIIIICSGWNSAIVAGPKVETSPLEIIYKIGMPILIITVIVVIIVLIKSKRKK